MTQTTVVIPTRDRAALLAETLRCIEEQSPRPAVIVVDDGSRDTTAEVLAAHEVTVVRNDAGGWGAGRARNAGLERATTPFVSFVDSDDLLLPGALTALEDALAGHPDAPFAFGLGLAASHDPSGWAQRGLIGPLPGEDPASAGAIFARNFVPSSGTLVRADVMRSAGGYDPSLVFSEDLDLWLRLALLGPPVHVARLVAVHRRHGGNRHLSTAAQRDEQTITDWATRQPALAGQVPARLGAQLCEEALEAARARRPQDAVVAAWRLFGRRRHRAQIATATLRHFKRRRVAGRLGEDAWARDHELQAWLARFA